MDRRRAVRTLLALGAPPLASCALPVAAPDAVVDGRDDPARDVAAVQAAVDRGGRVRLRGRFDFGERGSVVLARDVDVSGEPFSGGGRRTVIRGGRWSFYSPPVDRAAGAGAPGPAISIRDIDFDGAVGTPVMVARASGVRIERIVVRNVRPVALPAVLLPGRAPPTPISTQAGVVVGQRIVDFDAGHASPQRRPGHVSGAVTVVDSIFDMDNASPATVLGQGVYVHWTDGATIAVERNTVRGATRNAIEVVDNYNAGTRIVGNRVETAAEGIAWPGPQTPNGIVAGWFFAPSNATDPAVRGSLLVAGNEVDARGATSVGIVVLNDGARVESNRVRLPHGRGDAPLGATGIAVVASGVTVERNAVVGSGAAALATRALPAAPAPGVTTAGAVAQRAAVAKAADDNVFRFNDVRRFDGRLGAVHFGAGTARNVHEGAGPVRDDGTANAWRPTDGRANR